MQEIQVTRRSQDYFSDAETMAHYAHLVQQREPTVNNIIDFVDDVSIPIQC